MTDELTFAPGAPWTAAGREPPPGFEISDLGVRYAGAEALRGVDLDVRGGEILALVGPSGCGKTSLLGCLNRLNDMTAQCTVTGSVRIDGEELLSPTVNLAELRRAVGMVFQQPNPLPLSIEENIAFPLREHGVRSRERQRETVERVLHETGLWPEVKEDLSRSALALSGGQQQRLCIARAIALEPGALLFDEPCSALDPISTGVIEQLIAGMRERYTVIMATHNLAQARRLADRTGVFWMADGVGRLEEVGGTRQIFEAPRSPVTRAYVEGEAG